MKSGTDHVLFSFSRSSDAVEQGIGGDAANKRKEVRKKRGPSLILGSV
jgi:hypothetical protein